jgi:hypothetical protein
MNVAIIFNSFIESKLHKEDIIFYENYFFSDFLRKIVISLITNQILRQN